MKLIRPLAALFVAATATAHAATVTETYGPYLPNAVITDNEPVLTSFLTSITGSTIASLSRVEISFELRGSPVGEGFANDLFASLLWSPVGVAPTLTDPAAVLLNRVAGTDDGFGDFGNGYDGWNVTLRDDAAADIHTVSLVSGILTGTFQPAGRRAPGDTDRPAMLAVFNGLPGNGDWRLNVGDLAEAGTMRLASWSLTLVGEDSVAALPEAGTGAAALGVVTLLAATAWRRIRRRA